MPIKGRYIRQASCKAVLVPDDIGNEEHCRQLVATALREFGQLDILVNNAAYQMAHSSLQDVSSQE